MRGRFGWKGGARTSGAGGGGTTTTAAGAGAIASAIGGGDRGGRGRAARAGRPRVRARLRAPPHPPQARAHHGGLVVVGSNTPGLAPCEGAAINSNQSARGRIGGHKTRRVFSRRICAVFCFFSQKNGHRKLHFI